jgi:hypothetical protein
LPEIPSSSFSRQRVGAACRRSCSSGVTVLTGLRTQTIGRAAQHRQFAVGWGCRDADRVVLQLAPGKRANDAAFLVKCFNQENVDSNLMNTICSPPGRPMVAS